jgi:hypothetical protein
MYRIHKVTNISYTEQLQNIWVSGCPPYFDLSFEVLKYGGSKSSLLLQISSYLLCCTALVPGTRKGHLDMI